MPALLLANSILSLPAEAADRLLAAASGDAALLYLGLLRHGEVQPARKALGWTDQRAAAAFQELVKLSLAQGSVQAVAAPEEEDKPPAYQRSDLLASLRDDGTFLSLYQAMEKALGKPLSDADLQSLYTIYDYLGLPAEVIYQLTKWCTDQCERKYGPGRLPRMPMVKKEAFRWKRLGVETLAAAEEFLARQQALQGREADILPLLGIQGRAPVERERQYIAGWVDMGFHDDAIRLAYERTLFQKGAMNWAYMNSILKNWHAAGLHTAAQAEAGDKPPARTGQARPAGVARQPADRRQSAQKMKKDVDWLDQFVAQQNANGKER